MYPSGDVAAAGTHRDGGRSERSEGRTCSRTREDALYGRSGSGGSEVWPWPENRRLRDGVAQLCLWSDMPAMHFHVWVRSGQAFLMRPRVFESRHTAAKAARRLRSAAQDRLVLQCDACPPATRSKRRPPAWGRIAADLAADVGLPVVEVRRALAAAREADRRRRAPAGLSPGRTGGNAPRPSPGG